MYIFRYSIFLLNFVVCPLIQYLYKKSASNSIKVLVGLVSGCAVIPIEFDQKSAASKGRIFHII